MGYNLRKLGSLIFAFGLVNCSVDANVDQAIPMDNPIGSQQLAHSFDVSALGQRLPLSLPATRLSAAAFEQARIARSFIGGNETFTITNQLGDQTRSESPSYTLELDSRQGQLLLLRKLVPGPAVAVAEPELTQQSIARLAAWGLPADELGTTLQRRVLREDSRGNLTSGPLLHRYKTFVERAIGGIPVQGHRAVITYSPDAAFHRALIIWPPLASDGHLLTTSLSPTEIKSRADLELQKEGSTGGQVKLSWKYLASPTGNGEVTLRLVVSAQVRSEVQSGPGTELREFDIDVSAH